MFFITYLRRELRRRMRQAIFVALGLALGIGLVLTVTATSAGVRKAQSQVLRSLYGVGTDITVTGPAPKPRRPVGGTAPKGGQSITIGPGGAKVCKNGRCHSASGQTINNLSPGNYHPFGQSAVSSVAALRHVTAAAGGLILDDNEIRLPKNFGQPGSPLPQPSSFTLEGTDVSHPSLGPLSNGSVTAGRSLRTSDVNSDVAVVDSGYAKSNKLKVGSAVKIASHAFKVIGIVAQPQGSNPPQVYIPLRRAQALQTGDGASLTNKVNTIYVTAASASDIPAVQREIKHLLADDTVTTAASLASQVSGSLASTAKLANELGRWLSIMVLAAAFAVASLITMAAVTRRAAEFGTLKALGWRSRRIIAQVVGESVATGLIGGAVGVGLGFAGAAIISAVAPTLSASISSPAGQRVESFGTSSSGPGGPQVFSPTVTHHVAVPMSAVVSGSAVVLAVLLAIAGGLLAGSFASWRIARLRPAAALARVA
jgi:putative ABC transport system permease protein